MPEDVEADDRQPGGRAELVQHPQRADAAGPSISSSSPVKKTARVVRITNGPRSAQRRGGRALAPVGRLARVVTREPVPGAGQLERYGPDQQHAEEEVEPEQLADPDDRHAEHGE